MHEVIAQCPSIIRGTWQLSASHGACAEDRSAEAILDSIRLGLNRFDTADIYTGAEQSLGEAIRQARQEGVDAAVVHTKLVPDLSSLATISATDIEAIVDRSLKRLGVEQLPLVQFHWWDFSVPRYIEVLSWLFQLKKAGKVQAVGLTNFDSTTLQQVLDEGFECDSIQSQVSLLDHRVENHLRPLCREHNLKIFSYGTLAGGFLSDRWLNQPEPDMANLANRSLVKYKLIIDDWGGWTRFQNYLRLLRDISDHYNSTIAQISRRAIIQSGRADALIVGMSSKNWQTQNRELTSDNGIVLSQKDLTKIFAWHSPLAGDAYALERDRAGRHGSIMKYNLNNKSEAFEAERVDQSY